MFSALKKLVGSDQSPLRDKNIPAGLQSMNQALQRRFAKGVQYNMKIVIRGDRNTGKTTLWHRLQGKKFVEEYIPTQEIQVTSIHWNYKTTDDIVKVEVWDVVDKGKCKKRGDGLKLENEPQEAESEMALDAEFLDVYKTCNGVVMMFDITKQWTFNYILRELPKVPTHVPVCVLGNHRDMGEHRVILPDDVRECIQNLNRRPGSSYIRYAESSMKNSFGLKYLHKFFNIPFLQLQRETLLRQLETNQLDIDATLEELSVQQETEDQNYELFLEMMESRNRGPASPIAANGQSPSSGSQSPIIPPSSTSTESSSPGTPQQPPQHVAAGTAACPSPPPSVSPGTAAEVPALLASPLQVPSPPLPAAAAPQQRRSIISRIFGSSTPEATTPKPEDAAPTNTLTKVQNVEDFVPDDNLDSSFLEDPTPQKGKKKAECQERPGSDSEGEALAGNPMVAGFQDDLDPDDRIAGRSSLLTIHIPSKDIMLSSEEEEDPKVDILADDVINSEQREKWSSKNSLKPQQEVASTKISNQKPPVNLISSSWLDNNGNTQLSAAKPDGLSPASVFSASSSAVQPQKTSVPNKLSTPKQKGKGRETAESDSDQEGPIASQMLSFVMDDPDFDSEDSDSAAKKVDVFPVREDISDVSEEDVAPVKLPDALKPTVHPFRPKNDLDLFGLGFEEKTPAENSDEEKETKQPSKEKKKKKKSKEPQEDDKLGKKKTKHKKSKDKEDSKDDKKKKKKGKEKLDDFDELEAFLGGRDGASKARGGEDYEEL
ncbi:rab-like protein 6 isoform X2 [Rhinatrema bivittatum]|uniref:rab-like protein 6 isoform X2 n=1 Tax=Rhinatrema bivittatum TaxID=194408 RepID=UPI00112EB3B4|nr:rab-like protein 6 isoform X2 [Rhinatrema bivittatum]